MKTNLTKFAVIGVKRRQKAGFWGPISSKITLTKEKERRKRKSEEEEKGGGAEEKKSNDCMLSVYNDFSGDLVFG